MNQVEQGIFETYKRDLALPSEKAPKAFILAPVGLIGAGKTTILRELSPRLALVRISSDELRRGLKDAGQTYDAIPEMMEALAHEYLSIGHGIAIDADCASPHTQEYIKKLAAEYTVPVVWVHVASPEAFILEKLRTFSGDRWLTDDQEVMVANYEARKPLHENLTMPFAYVFDASREDFREQLVAGEAAIRAAVS